MSSTYHNFLKTPVGWLAITTSETALQKIDFLKTKPRQSASTKQPSILKKTTKQLEEFFQGQRKVFDLDLDLKGTDFQKKVWKALMKVPFGKTLSYKDIAKKVGNDKASRAIGMANNKNPIPLVIPCHRILGSNGKLVGYAPGVDKKEWLLNLEKNS